MLPGKNRFFFPLKELGKELWDGCVLQKQRAAGPRHPKPHGHSLKKQANRQGNPKIILLEFHLQQGCQGRKLTGAAYKRPGICCLGKARRALGIAVEP